MASLLKHTFSPQYMLVQVKAINRIIQAAKNYIRMNKEYFNIMCAFINSM